MATLTPPIPPAGTLHVHVQKISADEAIVTFNGAQHRVTAYRESNGAQVSVINELDDWTPIAMRVVEIAKQLTGARAVEHSKVAFTGLPDQLTRGATLPSNVEVQHAEVRVLGEREYRTFEGDTILPEYRTRIRNNLTQIGQEYNRGRTNALSRSTQLSSEPLHPLAQLCKDRPSYVVKVPGPDGVLVEQTGLEYALADQLRQMPDQPGVAENFKYNDKPVEEIVHMLRIQYATHLRDEASEHHRDKKFTSILNVLSGARTHDGEKLEIARQLLTGSNAISQEELEGLLPPNAIEMNDITKKKLVNLYAVYVEIGGKKHDKKFFNHFTQLHSLNPKFDVAIMGESGDIEKQPHLSGNNTALKNCLFLNGVNRVWHSYSRAGSATLQDLNEDRTVSTAQPPASPARPVAQPPRPNTLASPQDLTGAAASPARPAVQTPRLREIPRKLIPSDGRCLDRSIVDQIATINGTTLTEEQSCEQAILLRWAVSNILTKETQETLDNDPLFLKYLISSIKDIPSFKTGNYDDLKFYSGPDSEEFVNAESFAEIRELSERDIDDPVNIFTQEEKNLLRAFYATYITQSGSDGKMKNHLDGAFLYLIPHLNENYKVAVIHNNQIFATFSENKELSFEGWLFICYNGSNHYDSVDRLNPAARTNIDIQINVRKNKLISDFVNFFRENDEITRDQINNVLNPLGTQHPKACEALYTLITECDIDHLPDPDFGITEIPEEMDDDNAAYYGWNKFRDLAIGSDATRIALRDMMRDKRFSVENIMRKVVEISLNP